MDCRVYFEVLIQRTYTCIFKIVLLFKKWYLHGRKQDLGINAFFFYSIVLTRALKAAVFKNKVSV